MILPNDGMLSIAVWMVLVMLRDMQGVFSRGRSSNISKQAAMTNHGHEFIGPRDIPRDFQPYPTYVPAGFGRAPVFPEISIHDVRPMPMVPYAHNCLHPSSQAHRNGVSIFVYNVDPLMTAEMLDEVGSGIGMIALLHSLIVISKLFNC